MQQSVDTIWLPVLTRRQLAAAARQAAAGCSKQQRLGDDVTLFLSLSLSLSLSTVSLSRQQTRFLHFSSSVHRFPQESSRNALELVSEPCIVLWSMCFCFAASARSCLCCPFLYALLFSSGLAPTPFKLRFRIFDRDIWSFFFFSPFTRINVWHAFFHKYNFGQIHIYLK